MKILILGAGKMGSFFSDVLSFEHEVAIYDTDPQRLRFTFNTQRMTTMEEIEAFKPELLIKCSNGQIHDPCFRIRTAAHSRILYHIRHSFGKNRTSRILQES